MQHLDIEDMANFIQMLFVHEILSKWANSFYDLVWESEKNILRVCWMGEKLQKSFEGYFLTQYKEISVLL